MHGASSFGDWQANQLQSLADALAQATGRPASSVSATQASAAASAAPSSDGPLPAAGGAAAAPTGPLARTGTSARWLVLLAGSAVILGGFGLVCGATRQNRSPMRGV